MPIAGEDYPRNWVQFLDWFYFEDTRRLYLDKLRWPAGFICPKCKQAGNPCRSTRGRIKCLRCKFQTAIKAGTIFDRTRTELRVWFAAIWYITYKTIVVENAINNRIPPPRKSPAQWPPPLHFLSRLI